MGRLPAVCVGVTNERAGRRHPAFAFRSFASLAPATAISYSVRRKPLTRAERRVGRHGPLPFRRPGPSPSLTMVLFHGLLPPRFGRRRPLELSDFAWRSLVGPAATVDPLLAPLAPLARASRGSADARPPRRPEVQAVVTAVADAMPTLPCRSVTAWLDGMARAWAAGRPPAPADDWSTMEPQLCDVLACLECDGAMGCRVGRRPVAAPTDGPTATPSAPTRDGRPDGRAPDRAPPITPQL